MDAGRIVLDRVLGVDLAIQQGRDQERVGHCADAAIHRLQNFFLIDRLGGRFAHLDVGEGLGCHVDRHVGDFTAGHGDDGELFLGLHLAQEIVRHRQQHVDAARLQFEKGGRILADLAEGELFDLGRPRILGQGRRPLVVVVADKHRLCPTVKVSSLNGPVPIASVTPKLSPKGRKGLGLGNAP